MPKIVDHQARRRDISAATAKLIANGGLEAATMREIAHSSGYSKGVVEHYFENKQELIGGALEWANQCLESRVELMTRGLAGLAALSKRIEASLPMNAATRDEWRIRLVFWSMAAIHPRLRSQQAQRLHQAVAFYAQDIDAAIQAGEMSDRGHRDRQARRILNATTGISTACLHDTSTYNRARLEEEIHHLVDRLRQGHI